MTVLRARPFRSVVLAGDLARVVKRFHHPNPVLALFDRARARREHEALVALERAGFPVPRPLGLTSTKEGWEVHQSAIQGATPMLEHLKSGQTPPQGWAHLLARLGSLLARLQSEGWEHRDLHPGNVLVDHLGDPWLIDFQRARRVAPDRARCLIEVVDCAAVAREHLPPRLRARFLMAWLDGLPLALRPALAGAELARAIESRARQRRAELVCIGLNRWLRESSRVRAIRLHGAPAWARRESPEPPHPGTWLRLEGEREELRARWLGAARLHEHGLPVVRPALFWAGRRWSAGGAFASFEEPERGAKDPEALLEALAERGLALLRTELDTTERGTFFLPPRQPEDFAEPKE